MDEILAKLKESLLANGVPEDVVNFAFSEAMAEPEGEPAPEEVPAEEVVAEEPVAEEVPVEEAPVEEVPAEEPIPEEVAPQPEAPILPPELLEQLGQVESLKNEIEELKKANEGLLARIDSLHDALKTAGVIEGEAKGVDIGIHQPSAFGNAPVDDPMESVMAEINRRSRGY